MLKLTLQAAIDAYLLASRAEGKSDSTLKWYVWKLKLFLTSVGNVPLSKINSETVRKYLVSLREKTVRYPGRCNEKAGKLSTYTIVGHDRALRAFFNWLVIEYNLDPTWNPMKRIKKSVPGHTEPKAMILDDFYKLLGMCDDSLMGRRDRAILLFLADTGCRAGGLVGLTDQRLEIENRRAMVHEKGDKSRWVYFLPITAEALQSWLIVRPAKATTVFCGVNYRYFGQPLHVQGLQRLIVRLANKAGITGLFNPHAFRHMFAIESLENGNDLVTVSSLLGHTDLKTTQYYLQFTDKQRARKHDKFSPIAGLER